MNATDFSTSEIALGPCWLPLIPVLRRSSDRPQSVRVGRRRQLSVCPAAEATSDPSKNLAVVGAGLETTVLTLGSSSSPASGHGSSLSSPTVAAIGLSRLAVGTWSPVPTPPPPTGGNSTYSPSRPKRGCPAIVGPDGLLLRHRATPGPRWRRSSCARSSSDRPLIRGWRGGQPSPGGWSSTDLPVRLQPLAPPDARSARPGSGLTAGHSPGHTWILTRPGRR